jgi:hypothetical protein
MMAAQTAHCHPDDGKLWPLSPANPMFRENTFGIQQLRQSAAGPKCAQVERPRPPLGGHAAALSLVTPVQGAQGVQDQRPPVGRASHTEFLMLV